MFGKRSGMVRDRWMLRSVLALGVAGLLLAGCQTTEPPPTVAPAPEPEPPAPVVEAVPAPVPPAPEPPPPAPVPEFLRAAVLLPLSGESAAIGTAMAEAAEMALFDGGRPGLELIFRDTRGTEEGARRALADAARQRLDLIIGPLLGRNTAAVAPMARAMGAPLLSFSTDASVAGTGVGLMGILPGQQVRRITDFAARTGKRRFGLLAPQGALGDLVERAYRAAVADLGLELVAVSRYGGEFTSMRQAVNDLSTSGGRDAAIEEQLAALADRTDPVAERARARLEAMRDNSTPTFGFDALLIAESGQPLRQLMPLLAQVGIDGRSRQILGLGLWDAEQALGLEPALVGAWYAAPPAQQRDAFLARYASTYDRQPIRLTTLAYDAVSLAGTLMADAGLVGISMADLVTPTGFQGVDGLFRFRTDGLNERVLAVYEIRRGDAVVVDPAPRSLAPTATQALPPAADDPANPGPTEALPDQEPTAPAEADAVAPPLVGG